MFICLIFFVDTFGYDIVADIRVNNNGKDKLYHNGFKFTKNKTNQNSINWICCKRASKQCKSMVSTIEVNGTIMMIWNGIDQTHDPEFD